MARLRSLSLLFTFLTASYVAHAGRTLSTVSNGGSCGPNVGGCQPGSCCSKWGYCGVGASYCGSGIQSPPPSPSLISPSPSPSPSHSNFTAPSPSPKAATTPPPSTGTCTVIASLGGQCGVNANGTCCSAGQCCSQWGSCGVDVAHCGSGCQASYSSANSCGNAPPFVAQSPPPPHVNSPPVILSPSPSPSPPFPPHVNSPPYPPNTGGILFSPYKDITSSMDGNTFVLATKITGTVQPLTHVMPAAMHAITLAFASGECGAESWAGVTPAQLASNIPALIAAGKSYIISTGGQNGAFTCANDTGFATFLQSYHSANMLGVDFDIEGGQTQYEIGNLTLRIKHAKTMYPTMRFSFTLATLGAAQAGIDQLGAIGQRVMQAIKDSGLGWDNLFINLMAMDYGSDANTVCALQGSTCNMGQSAINAAESLHAIWGVPYSSIELTPMIGGNDIRSETFTLADTATVSAYAVNVGLGGVHHWSFDRDTDCPPSWSSSTCNTYGTAGTLGFSNAFIAGLNGNHTPIANPPPSPVTRLSPSPSPTPTISASPPSPSIKTPPPPMPKTSSSPPSPPPSKANPPSPTSSTPPPTGTCSVIASLGGQCGANANGACCSVGQCCSQWGSCGVDVAHCGNGCQASYSSANSCGNAPPFVAQSPPPPHVNSPPVILSPSPSPSPPSPPHVNSPPYPPHTGGILFSAYKDITASMDWNTYFLTSKVTGTSHNLTHVMPAAMHTISLAFATGECGTESWGGVTIAQFTPNIPMLVGANKSYILSTGGANGQFTCGSDAAFIAFIKTYYSAKMLGVDFDIESYPSPSDLANLIARIKYAKTVYPTMRFSFTLATLGSSAAGVDQLGVVGKQVLQAIKDSGLGWDNLFINLMAMDYGTPANSGACAMQGSTCNMGQSAINAAEALHAMWNVPYSSIELTPMIGGNDQPSLIFTLADTATVSAYAVRVGLGAVHFWSFDRDADCPNGTSSGTCNTYGVAGTLGFSNAFIAGLGLTA